MDDLLKQGFKAKCTFKEEDSQFLAVLEVEGISERFSTYSNTKVAAKTSAANLAQAYISSNGITPSQLSSNDTFMPVDKTEDETPISMFKRMYPDFQSSFEMVCTLTVGEEEFQGRGESRGIAKTRASANALESLNGVTFDMEKFENYFKKELKDTCDIEKHPASALHEVVGQTAVFTFEEEIRPGAEWKTFICSVTIEDKQFSGVAHNKRLAKYNSAVNALKGLGLMKKFKLMSPPVANTPQPSDGGFKRRASEPYDPAAPWDTPKRGRGTRGGSVSSRPFFQGLKVDTPPRFDRGRSRALGRGNSRPRGGAGYGGRGQAVGRQSTPSFAPMESYKVEPGYGGPSAPYPGYTDSYNQGYDPGYNSGFGYARPTPSPVAVPRLQTARSNPYPQQMGNMGYGGYQY